MLNLTKRVEFDFAVLQVKSVRYIPLEDEHLESLTIPTGLRGSFEGLGKSQTCPGEEVVEKLPFDWVFKTFQSFFIDKLVHATLISDTEDELSIRFRMEPFL